MVLEVRPVSPIERFSTLCEPPKSDAGSNFGDNISIGDLSIPESEKRSYKFPKSVIFIIANEFCERFCFYGMQAILSFYLTEMLKFNQDTATILFHLFAMFVYFFPVFGAIIADSWLGKFKTILYLSIVYAIGSTIVSLGAISTLNLPHVAISLMGLLFIAVGSGGIKPCVSSFGGDQFILPYQETQLVKFFSMYYFAVNSGSLISTFITPILRKDVHCFGEETCYPLAFGVPGVLMLISIVFFVLGKPLYKVNKKPTGNIIVEVTSCIKHAIARRKKFKKFEVKDHWLDYANDKFDQEFINGVKTVMHVLIIFIPVPIFWALFDQQGSRWTFQASQMSGDIGFYEIKPDQMQVINPLFILAFIPLFETVIYPILAKCNLLVKPLQRLTVGGFLAALAFVVSALVEIALKQTYPIVPEAGLAQVRIYNGLNCDLHFQNVFNNNSEVFVPSLGIFNDMDVTVKNSKSFHLNFVTNCSGELKFDQDIVIKEKMENSFFFYGDNSKLVLKNFTDDNQRNATGAKLRILPNIKTIDYFEFVGKNNLDNRFQINLKNIDNVQQSFNLTFGSYTMTLKSSGTTVLSKDFSLKMGGVYSLVLTELDKKEVKTSLLEITEPNSICILWLIPQYVLLTASEVMFSITGLEFSYSQAPTSMKSVLSSVWLLTTAIGNLIVVIVVEVKFFNSQEYEFLFFASLMALTMFAFIFLARNYKYVKFASSDNNSYDEDELQKTGETNLVYSNDKY